MDSELQHCSSEPILNIERISDEPCASNYLAYVGTRKSSKRQRVDVSEAKLIDFMGEMTKMWKDFQVQQNSSYERLVSAVEDIRASIDFVANKYDSLQTQINKLEEERKVNSNYISALENKLEKYEQMSRSTCIEIRNVPIVPSETKTSLMNTVINTAKVLNISMEPRDIKDVFRIKSRDPVDKTIIVDFTSVIMKDKLITVYRKKIKESNKLTTENLHIPGPVKPIFISENLSAKMKRLFYLAREYAKQNDYKYCWVTHGKIFIRKRDGDRFIKIMNESDLHNTQNHKD
ncbi:hypothetical protein K1T71_012327 [Dendrolimus kikuchii]|uniref:Uncharacterized protein n=1 Tax=Dendrolimus kikuchii TaxID=765133 RepID=A0ACC1CL85_9NEOP|nr:hypothetical protein K1T71_014857 [Dendrolimus kikuchii]KAJ0172354.1 hypothetical protein K1T71_012327 [Dendrolimus kikuchii]